MPPQVAQAFSLQAFYRYVVNGDDAGMEGNEAVDSAKEGGLTRSAGAKHGHLLPAVQGERDAVQYRRRIFRTHHDQVVDLQDWHRFFSRQRRDSVQTLKTFSALQQFS